MPPAPTTPGRSARSPRPHGAGRRPIARCSIPASSRGGGGWFAEWLALDPDGDAMDAANPVVIPRNHLVDEALDAATAGDLAPFERLLDAVTHPFDRRPGFERYERPAPPGGPPHVTYCGT